METEGNKFLISRDIFEHPIWQSPSEFRLFFFLIGKCMFSEGVKVGDIILKKGQYIRSYRNLREDLAYIENGTLKYYGLGKIKRIVDSLISDGRICKTDTEYGTLFTVLNYSEYQALPDKNKEQRNTNGTPTEHQRNNNKNVKTDKKEYKEIVEYLNDRTGKNFQANSNTTLKFIDARLNDGFTVQDFKKVIDIKTKQWKGDGKWDNYLRPQTLFGNKFESYLNEVDLTKIKTTSDKPTIEYKPKMIFRDEI